jgi:hypothetical protein
MEKIKIYRFIDPSDIYQNQTLLLLMLGTTQHNYQRINLYIDHEKGHFVYKNFYIDNLTFNRSNIIVPQSEDAARKVATEFIAKANTIVTENPNFKNKKFPRLFTNLRFVSAVSIGDPIHPSIRSWEIKFMPFVSPSTYETAAPVVDAEVVIEVGFKNNIVGLRYFWLPLSRSEDVDRFTFVYKDKDGSALNPSIVYKSEPGMNLIAPYLTVYDPKKLNEIQNQLSRQLTV